MAEEKKLQPIPRWVFYSLLIIFLSSIVMTIVSIQYANYVDRQSNQKLCGMIIAVDDAFKNAPSSGSSGQKVAEAFRNLRVDFEC